MGIKRIFAAVFLFSNVLALSFTDPAVFELGGKNGWGMLQYTENIQMCP